LTLGLSFGHNLCLKCPNGSCEPILNIYILTIFRWYMKVFNPMGFGPCNHSLKIWESVGTLTPKVGAHLGVWGFIPSLSYTRRSMKCDSQASLLARTFTSPCFGHEPKAKVATLVLTLFICLFSLFIM
jgi:hypothetical protein